MTTVAQLIEAPKNFPPHVEIECGKLAGDYDAYLQYRAVGLTSFNVIDYTSNANFIKYGPWLAR